MNGRMCLEGARGFFRGAGEDVQMIGVALVLSLGRKEKKKIRGEGDGAEADGWMDGKRLAG